jgi:poly(3-hydroxybutyrate) depolymerase
MLSKYHAGYKSNFFFPALRINLALLLLAFAPMSLQPANAQIETRPLTHNGYLRPYLIFLPAHPPPHPAVVLMLGGIRSTAKSEAKNFGWKEEAERNGFLTVFPEPVATRPDQPGDRENNVTFWEMNGSRTHLLGPGKLPVDDDGYLSAIIRDLMHRDHPDRKRIFLAGFSSGSGMVQLFASRHSRDIGGVFAVATPLMDPPARLAHPVPILYIHGDDDEQFSGFEANSPHFATTPHGNWITWGYLNGCETQTAEKTEWGVRFTWRSCKNQVPVIADFVAHFGHEWSGSLDAHWDKKYWPNGPLNFTDIAWQFFAGIHTN